MTATMEQDFVETPEGLYMPSEAVDASVAASEKKLKYRDAGASYRRQKTIHGYIGANGHGKSLAMVHDTLSSLARGRTVLSTVKLLDPATGEAHPSYERLTDWSQILEAEHCDILFDEVLGIANSRASQGMPQQVQVLLNQLRRRDIVLRWTAPAWTRADIIIREVSQAVTICRGYLPKDFSEDQGAGVKAWRARRLFRWQTYSAIDFSTMTDSKTVKVGPELTRWFWGPGSEAFSSYSTLDAVERVGEVLDAGTCAHCGGTRARKKCTCDDHEH